MARAGIASPGSPAVHDQPLAIEHRRRRSASPARRPRQGPHPAPAPARPSTWITLNAMSEVTRTSGRAPSRLSCWATRTSLERVEIAMPIQTEQRCQQWGEDHLGEDVLRRGGSLLRRRVARTGRRQPETAHRSHTRWRWTAAAPPAPCPAGIPRDGSAWSGRAQGCPAHARPRRNRQRASPASGPGSRACRGAGARRPANAAVEAGARKTTNNGWTRKMVGKIASATTIDRLRRYSRSSLRTMARMRRAFTFTGRPPPRPRR